jgi:hypothetical protein
VNTDLRQYLDTRSLRPLSVLRLGPPTFKFVAVSIPIQTNQVMMFDLLTSSLRIEVNRSRSATDTSQSLYLSEPRGLFGTMFC